MCVLVSLMFSPLSRLQRRSSGGHARSVPMSLPGRWLPTEASFLQSEGLEPSLLHYDPETMRETDATEAMAIETMG